MISGYLPETGTSGIKGEMIPVRKNIKGVVRTLQYDVKECVAWYDTYDFV
jgi:hypothetical protein